jgi:hypothetical protein
VAKASGKVWLIQAKSDLDCAARVFDEKDSATYCHAIAKYQQAVEKSVKGVVAALRDAGILGKGPTYHHGLEDEITILKLLRPDSKNSRGKDLASRVHRFLDTAIRGELKRVSDLAPRKPSVGETLEPRNTEYPFQRHDGTWTAPADPGAFTSKEVEEFRRIAGRTVDWAEDIIFAVTRIKGRS